jgi:DNA-binding beta-propeller fold protein YncE
MVNFRCCSTALLLLLFTGCSAVPREFVLHGESSIQRTWPGLPEVPRYRYLGDLTGESNFRAAGDEGRVTAGRVLRWLVGLDSLNADRLRLVRPQSGLVDPGGRILVTDAGLQGVVVFDTAQNTVDLWQTADGGQPLVSPIGITRDADDFVYVADSELNAVIRFRSDGSAAGLIRHPDLERPTGIAWDPESHRLFVADTRAHDIKVFNSRGELLETVGDRGTAPGQFNAPTHLDVHHNSLLITDTLNARVQVMNFDTGEFRVIGNRGLYVGNLTHPKGVCADDDGNVYIVESYYDHLLVFNQDGKYLLPIGGSGSGPGQFFLPAGVWMDSGNRLFVADMFNSRVSVFQFLGG